MRAELNPRAYTPPRSHANRALLYSNLLPRDEKNRTRSHSTHFADLWSSYFRQKVWTYLVDFCGYARPSLFWRFTLIFWLTGQGCPGYENFWLSAVNVLSDRETTAGRLSLCHWFWRMDLVVIKDLGVTWVSLSSYSERAFIRRAGRCWCALSAVHQRASSSCRSARVADAARQAQILRSANHWPRQEMIQATLQQFNKPHPFPGSVRSAQRPRH